jgi:hypothetical protein
MLAIKQKIGRCWLALLAVSLFAAQALGVDTESSEPSLARVELSAAQIKNFGIEATPLASATSAGGQILDAVVLDSAPLIAQFADLASATQTLALSQQVLARTQRLYRNQQNASAAELAQATLAANNDALNQQRALSALSASLGPAFDRWSATQQTQFAEQLKRHTLCLVRAELRSAAQAVSDAQFEIIGAVGRLNVIGTAPSVDVQNNRQAILMSLTPALAIATRLQIRQLPTMSVNTSKDVLTESVIVPRAALLRLNGGNFVFVQSGEGEAGMSEFTLRELHGVRRTPEGWRVQAGVAADERVVTQGGASLLTAVRGVPEED